MSGTLRDPYYSYRPIKVRVSGAHGRLAEFDETISGVTPTTVYGTMRVHDNETQIILERGADVHIGDLLRLRED